MRIIKIEYANIIYFNYNQFEKAIIDKMRKDRKLKNENIK